MNGNWLGQWAQLVLFSHWLLFSVSVLSISRDPWRTREGSDRAVPQNSSLNLTSNRRKTVLGDVIALILATDAVPAEPTDRLVVPLSILNQEP